MKRPFLVVLFVGLLIWGGIFAASVKSRNTQRQWPHKQLQSAMELGVALSEYRNQHGSYPARLEDLVHGGTIVPKKFTKLLFQSDPKADPEPWLYKVPLTPSEIAIVAPQAIHSWDEHSGSIATGRADGGGELIPEAKRHQIPTWSSKWPPNYSASAPESFSKVDSMMTKTSGSKLRSGFPFIQDPNHLAKGFRWDPWRVLVMLSPEVELIMSLLLFAWAREMIWE